MNNKNYCVTRPFDGITINTEVEYLLDDNGDVMLFDSTKKAKSFLLSHGFTEEDLGFVRIEKYEE